MDAIPPAPRPPAAPPSEDRLDRWAALLALTLVMAAQLPLWWSWLQDPATRLIANPFTGGHVWAAEVVSDALWDGRWPDPTDQAGFPGERAARFVGWAVLLAATVLRPLLSAHAVVHLAGMVGPALGAALIVPLARRISPDTAPGWRVLGAVLFGLSPVTLGAAVSGQVENTQLWILPALLLLTLRAPTGRGSRGLALLLAVPLMWGLSALTSPYLALLAALASPWAAWRAWRSGAPAWRAVLALALAAGALLLVRAWLDPGAFDPETVLFRPTWVEDQWPAIAVRPLPVASVEGLLTGQTLPQARAMVIHQPYLGLILLAAALLVGGQRRALLPLALLGVGLALGPRLVLTDSLVQLGGHEVVLPGQLARTFHLPVARGGQYYRSIVLAHLALAIMVACGGRPRWFPRGRGLAVALGLMLGAVGVADSLRSVRHFGLPWPTWELPVEAWAALGADPVPGAVLNLPVHSPRLVPNHPERLAGRAFHGRPVAAMPRAWVDPPQDPVLSQVHDASLAHPRAELPPLAALQALGFRHVVIDLDRIPERAGLYRRAKNAWGAPSGRADDGTLWWATDTPPPGTIRR